MEGFALEHWPSCTPRWETALKYVAHENTRSYRKTLHSLGVCSAYHLCFRLLQHRVRARGASQAIGDDITRLAQSIVGTDFWEFCRFLLTQLVNGGWVLDEALLRRGVPELVEVLSNAGCSPVEPRVRIGKYNNWPMVCVPPSEQITSIFELRLGSKRSLPFDFSDENREELQYAFKRCIIDKGASLSAGEAPRLVTEAAEGKDQVAKDRLETGDDLLQVMLGDAKPSSSTTSSSSSSTTSSTTSPASSGAAGGGGGEGTVEGGKRKRKKEKKKFSGGGGPISESLGRLRGAALSTLSELLKEDGKRATLEAAYRKQQVATVAALLRLTKDGLGMKEAPVGLVVQVIRAYVIAGDVESATRVARSQLPRKRAWEYIQLPYLRSLITAGILDEDEDPATPAYSTTDPVPDAETITTAHRFLAAAAAASLGDQQGSKHGAVLYDAEHQAEPTHAVTGHNHRFVPFPSLLNDTIPDPVASSPSSTTTTTSSSSSSSSSSGDGDGARESGVDGVDTAWEGPWTKGDVWERMTQSTARCHIEMQKAMQLRRFHGIPKLKLKHMSRSKVMHAEVHCLQQLPDIATAKGASVLVVELAADGVSYEEAVPCPMCSKGLVKTGVKIAYYSAIHGIDSISLSHKPEMVCEALDFALG